MEKVTIILFICRQLVWIWDIFTYPIYSFIYKQWMTNKPHSQLQIEVTSRDSNSITIRSTPAKQCDIVDQMKSGDGHMKSLHHMFEFAVDRYGDSKCLGSRQLKSISQEVQLRSGKTMTKMDLGDYMWTSYRTIARKVQKFGLGLREVGVEPNDKIAIFADTQEAWLVAAFACFRHCIGVVTIYTNLGKDGIIHGIGQTKSKLVITSDSLLHKIADSLPRLPNVEIIVVIEDLVDVQDIDMPTNISMYSFSDIIELADQSLFDETIEFEAPDRDDTAIVMYTSGSTGVPKGVVLSHGNLVSAVNSILCTIEGATNHIKDQCYIAYLPLAHVMELLAEIVMLVMGVPIGYSSVNTLSDSSTMIMKGQRGDAIVLKPTTMACVPIILDKIMKGISSKVEQRGWVCKFLNQFCLEYKSEWMQRGLDTPILNFFIIKKVREALGGRVQFILSGGAPLSNETYKFISTMLGLAIYTGYGLTETAATATICNSGDIESGHVGVPLEGVELKLVNWEEGGYMVNDDENGPRGEIIVGGDQVAMGYFEMPEQTEREFFVESGKRWYRTGDIGQLNPNGTLKIIDRKKDLVKLQMGEYVSLSKVEINITTHPMIDNMCVCAHSDQTFAVALVVPNQVNLQSFACKQKLEDVTFLGLCSNPLVIKHYVNIVSEQGNRSGLEKFEIPRRVFLVPDIWCPESGLITSAMKLRRIQINRKYHVEIMNMYTSEDVNISIKNGSCINLDANRNHCATNKELSTC